MDRRAFLQSLLASLTVTAISPSAATGDMSPFAGQAVRQPLLTVQIPSGQFVTLCMHDVQDDVLPEIDHDPYAISTKMLAAFFDWMYENDWHPVSLQQILDARMGKTKLPRNAVLLSWDDGLVSIYTKVFPLLKAFHYPALFALETRWLVRVQQGETVHYQGDGFSGSVNDAKNIVKSKALAADELQAEHSGNIQEPRKVFYNGAEIGISGFATWLQIREMQASGLVEFASHSHDMHHGILANPQGNVEPSAITHQYLAQANRYENDVEFHTRIQSDLTQSADIIEREVGVRPRAMIWPYGAMTPETEAIAVEAGMPISFGLGDRYVNNETQSTSSYGRLLIMNDPKPVAIEAQVAQSIKRQPPIERAVQIDMDYLYDPDPKIVNDNLGKLLDRIKALQIRTVYLQAFADPDGNGTVSALYFPNRVLPMRADLFNRVAWQLRTRAGVRVFAWLPMLAFHLPDVDQGNRLSVKAWDVKEEIVPGKRDYQRLSPFLPESLAIVGNIYADLGKSCSGIAGLLIHDDAYLAEDEDATVLLPEARWPGTDHVLPEQALTARQKTQVLIDFGKVITQRLQFHTNVSNAFSVARNLYARVVLDPSAEARFAQALDPFLANYDHVVLMAMPYLDGTTEVPKHWLQRLAAAVAKHPDGLRKVVFELQTRNWVTQQWIDGATLKDWMQMLIRLGAANLAYYPDDFLGDHPPSNLLSKG